MNRPPVPYRRDAFGVLPERFPAGSLPGRQGKADAIREAKARRERGEAVVAQRRADRLGWEVCPAPAGGVRS